MLGAIIGDLAGSIYEFDQIKQVKPIKMQHLIEENAFFSDDTILTVAVADALLSGKDFETKIKGLYVGGDGAGLTRGLAQAGANGVYVARHIVKKLENA